MTLIRKRGDVDIEVYVVFIKQVVRWRSSITRVYVTSGVNYPNRL